MILNPANDGINHINMYSKGNTEFGRMLSDFYLCPIETPDGNFLSVEGYWYWLSLPEEYAPRELLRKFYGYRAKQMGRMHREAAQKEGYKLRFEPQFEKKILSAIEQKMRIEARLFKPEYENLPIYHYYVFNGKVKDVTNDFPWLINGIRQLVKQIYNERNSHNS